MNFPPIDFPARIAAVAARLRREGADAYVGTRQAALHYLHGAFMPWRGAVIVTADGACETSLLGDGCLPRARGRHRRHPDGILVRRDDRGHPRDARAPGRRRRPGRPRPEPSGRGTDRAGHADGVRVPGPAVEAAGGEARERHPLDRRRDAHQVARRDRAPEAGRPRLGHRLPRGPRRGASRRHGEPRGRRDRAGHPRPRQHLGLGDHRGTEVGSGPRTGFLRGVTQQATDRPLGRDEFVILDLHPMIDLYLADTSIPVFLGKPSARQAAMIDCWEDVAATMLAGLTPGRPIAECVKEGIATFAKHGFSDFSLPLFGHGLGTCARTRPFLNLRSDDVVQPGMVVALGTHLYVPDAGGMRLEFPAMITERGAEPLVETPPKVHRVAA
ncbi:MAG: M24 family metallopeptidase [Betaproteobacteria bacterium]|nr:M24 family metallopeptidase [Betaproteobacteria bacterium]